MTLIISNETIPYKSEKITQLIKIAQKQHTLDSNIQKHAFKEKSLKMKLFFLKIKK